MSKSTIIQVYTDAIYTHKKNIVGAGPPHYEP